VDRRAKTTNSATNTGTRSQASKRTHDQTRTRTQTNQLKANGGYLEVGWETQPQQFDKSGVVIDIKGADSANRVETVVEDAAVNPVMTTDLLFLCIVYGIALH